MAQSYPLAWEESWRFFLESRRGAGSGGRPAADSLGAAGQRITSFRPSSAEAQVARVRPSGEKQTPAMELACPLRVASSARDFRSQRRTSISLPPEASVRPSGEKVTEVTSPALP